MTDRLDRQLDALDLRADLEDIELDKATLHQLALMRRVIRLEASETRELIIEEARRIRLLIRHQGENIMANLDSVNAALGDLSTQISQLAAQVAELQAGTVTQEQLDSVAAGIAAAAASVDAIIEPDAGETTT